MSSQQNIYLYFNLYIYIICIYLPMIIYLPTYLPIIYLTLSLFICQWTHRFFPCLGYCPICKQQILAEKMIWWLTKPPERLAKLTWGLGHRSDSAKTPLPLPSPNLLSLTHMHLYFQNRWLREVEATSTITTHVVLETWTCHKSSLSPERTLFSFYFVSLVPSSKPEVGSSD